MSLKKIFKNINNPEVKNVISNYFKTYYNSKHLFDMDFLNMDLSNIITTLFNRSNRKINKNVGIYKHSIYKLIDKLEKEKVDCSEFDYSNLLSIIRLSMVAYKFALNTNIFINPENKGISDSSMLRLYVPNQKIVSFRKYKKSASKVMKDIDVYHDQIVEWYKKNEILPSTPTKLEYNLRTRIEECRELCDKIEEILLEQRCNDEKFLLIEEYNIHSFPSIIGKIDSSTIYTYLLKKYIEMIDDITDTSGYTDDDIIELAKEYNNIYESTMKSLLESDLKLKHRLYEYQLCPGCKMGSLEKDMFHIMKALFKAFMDNALSKMKNSKKITKVVLFVNNYEF